MKKVLGKIADGFTVALGYLFWLGIVIVRIAVVVLAYALPIAVALLIVQKCV